MSESVLANLPRFDTSTPGQARSGLGKGRFDASGAGAADSDIDQLTDVEQAQLEHEQIARRTAELDAAIEATLSSFAQSLGRIEAEAHARTMAMLKSMTEALFPKLSDMFLAEEISRHLPDILPDALPDVEILATPDVANRLADIIEKRGGLPGNVSVKPAETHAAGQVNISWKTGGLDFDFEDLLTACTAQLNAHNDTD